MTSTKKIAASRSNATKSTGPKTAQGKKRARTNALRHGLAAIAPRDPATSAEIERLARWFCGDGVTPEQYEHARAIAEEHIMLQRVEAAYVAIIERAMNTAHDEADQRQSQVWPQAPHVPQPLQLRANSTGYASPCLNWSSWTATRCAYSRVIDGPSALSLRSRFFIDPTPRLHELITQT
jgi:hypothetical protein